jgi:NAD(P)-dependent dehydrogenase (short-subunit alcohol dehydrogenase family)
MSSAEPHSDHRAVQRLTGKIAIVTGAAGSIGAETVRAFADEGARVVAVDRTWEGTRADWSDAIVRLSADVTNEGCVARMIDDCAARAGRIDILFNNAAIEGPRAEIPDYPLECFRAVMDVNVIGVFLGMKYTLPLMAQQRSGSILNASSLGGLRGTCGMSGYVASKHAVLGLTRAAALEWGGRGVRVNSIHPGYIDSRMMDEYLQHSGAPTREQVAAKVPLGRLGSPTEIARLAVFLGSDESAYITGAAYSIDGGVSAG